MQWQQHTGGVGLRRSPLVTRERCGGSLCCSTAWVIAPEHFGSMKPLPNKCGRITEQNRHPRRRSWLSACAQGSRRTARVAECAGHETSKRRPGHTRHGRSTSVLAHQTSRGRCARGAGRHRGGRRNSYKEWPSRRAGARSHPGAGGHLPERDRRSLAGPPGPHGHRSGHRGPHPDKLRGRGEPRHAAAVAGTRRPGYRSAGAGRPAGTRPRQWDGDGRVGQLLPAARQRAFPCARDERRYGRGAGGP